MYKRNSETTQNIWIYNLSSSLESINKFTKNIPIGASHDNYKQKNGPDAWLNDRQQIINRENSDMRKKVSHKNGGFLKSGCYSITWRVARKLTQPNQAQFSPLIDHCFIDSRIQRLPAFEIGTDRSCNINKVFGIFCNRVYDIVFLFPDHLFISGMFENPQWLYFCN